MLWWGKERLGWPLSIITVLHEEQSQHSTARWNKGLSPWQDDPAGWGINGRIEKFEEHKWQVVEALSGSSASHPRRKGTQVLTCFYKPQHSMMIRDDTYIQPVHDVLVCQNVSPFTLAVGFRTKPFCFAMYFSLVSDGGFPASFLFVSERTLFYNWKSRLHLGVSDENHFTLSSPQFWPIYLHFIALQPGRWWRSSS